MGELQLPVALDGLVNDALPLVNAQYREITQKEEFVQYFVNEFLSEPKVFALFQGLNSSKDRLSVVEGDSKQGYESYAENGTDQAIAVRICNGFEDGKPVYGDTGLLLENSSEEGVRIYKVRRRPGELSTFIVRSRHPMGQGEIVIRSEDKIELSTHAVNEHYTFDLLYNTLLAATLKAQEGTRKFLEESDEIEERNRKIESLAAEIAELKSLVDRIKK